MIFNKHSALEGQHAFLGASKYHSVYNRIALDCASISIQHVRLDDSERFLEKISSGLNDCLNLSANIDQTGRAFLQDIVLSMLDEGCV